MESKYHEDWHGCASLINGTAQSCSSLLFTCAGIGLTIHIYRNEATQKMFWEL